KDAHVLGTSETIVMMGQNTPINAGMADNDQGLLVSTSLNNTAVDDEFVKVMGLKVVQGRDFSTHLLTDVGTNWLVNEAMVRKMGWTDPIGKRIQLGPRTGRVIGVVRDFNFKSLHSPIEPFGMVEINDDFSRVPPAFQVFQQRLLVVDI